MEALPGKGFEPLQACAHSPLKAACLPIPPPGQGRLRFYRALMAARVRCAARKGVSQVSPVRSAGVDWSERPIPQRRRTDRLPYTGAREAPLAPFVHFHEPVTATVS